MAIELAPTLTPVANGSPTPPPVETPKQPGQSQGNSAPGSAMATVPQFGGNRGGKARRDNLVPGSPEAIAADREKERLKKQRQRAAKRAENPPVLPSKLSETPSPAAGAPPAPPSGETVGSIDSGLTTVAWTPDDLREIFVELVPTAEQELVGRITRKAATAKLPAPLLKEIEQDARWGETTKKGIILGGSGTCAKWLNKAGVSAEYKAEVVLALSILRLGTNHLRISRRLDDLIREQQKLNEQQQQQKEKGK